MDSHYSSSYITIIPTRPFEAFNSDSRNSPNSPFSTHFQTETLASLEQRSSTDNLSDPSLDRNTFQQSIRSGHPYSLRNANRLLELGNTLMAVDEVITGATTSDYFLGENSPSRTPPGPSRMRNQESEWGSRSRQSDPPRDFQTGFPPNNLKQILTACARALSEDKLNEFGELIELARSAVSVSGEPIQRLGAYLAEALIARKESSGNNIYRALKCNQPASKDLLSYMQILYEMCPYFKFGYMAANGAIAEACRNDDRVHIIDFQIAQGTQWLALLQALAVRPGGPPHVRFTGVDDPISRYARGDGLSAVGRRLAEISEKFSIPVEFHPVPVFASDIKRAMLNIRPGESLAVNFPLHLHHTPDESVDVTNPRDGLLRMVKSLSPKVVTLVEQESNTNTAPFLPRFVETLEYYSAMFESIDVAETRDSKKRINVEQHCLARDIVNIIACEGKERIERHELFGKWRSRFMMAGFEQFPLSSHVNLVIRGLLRCYSGNYTLLEKDGAMLLGWKDRNLVSASAWH
ncbi:Chitin-inducible gibberellin-responsive protein 1 [Orobanche gracilis]